MNYPNNFTGTNMDVRSSHESDMADDDLQSIVDKKRELQIFIHECTRKFRDVKLNEMRLLMEEQFDEAFTAKWVKLRQASGSIGWPEFIPPFETITFDTPKQAADRLWMRNGGAA